MCSNYEAVSRADRLLSFFGVVRQDQEGPILTWPTAMAPFIRLAEDGSGNRRVDDGAFGLLPGFAKELAYGRKQWTGHLDAFPAPLPPRPKKTKSAEPPAAEPDAPPPPTDDLF